MSFADEAAEAMRDELAPYFGETGSYRFGGSSQDMTAVWHSEEAEVDQDVTPGGERYIRRALMTVDQTAWSEIAEGAEYQRPDGTAWRFLRVTDNGDGTWLCHMALPADRVQNRARRVIQ